MSPTDRTTLAKKLTYLQQVLEEIEKYRGKSKEEFLKDREVQAIVERHLQTSVESVIDCSRMLVTILGWRRVKEETDSLLILARHEIITEDLAKKLTEARKFRNVLVHLYADVDPEIVYMNLQKGYKDLVVFEQAMAGWLKEHRVE